MRNRSRTTTILALGAAALLAACEGGADNSATDSADGGGGDPASETASEAKEAVPMAGTAWLTVGTDGAVQTTLIDTGGRYRDFRNGELFAEGSWQQRPDGTICFEPDTGVGACWSTEAGDADGTVLAINGDDKRIELKRVTYTAPPETDDEEAAAL